jgi:hypothetical protein
MAEKGLDILVHLIKEVRRGILRNAIYGELGNTQAECYGLLADLQDEVVKLYEK